MAEYIDREKMLKYLEENNTADEWIVSQYNADWIYNFIESQPTADVVEVKHGEWESFEIPHMMRCSECGVSELDIHRTKFDYCPNCGAKMDGGTKIT